MLPTQFDVDAIFAAEGKIIPCATGKAVYHAGDAGVCAYIVKRGRIEIRQRGRPVESLQSGEIFGEMGLIDGGTRMGTAVASEPSEVVPICAPLFASLIRDDEEFALTVMRLMARRHRATLDVLEGCLDQAATPPPVGIPRRLEISSTASG